ncbi:MAG: replication factor C small subunit [Candidatus Heimdallarchaeota archaeon]|nr:replication factor C small subunit [Candidatus Heimdallarchaeota archaeon]
MNYNIMWVEKYRPKKIEDIIGHEETKTRLKGFISSNSLPHLLFAGPPGTGKTSAVIALAREIFNESSISGNLLELNASDDRGIDVIRNQVKDFARILPIDNAPFKIISLDEADALTSAAQHALRRTMEKYVNTSRFVLLCNYPSKIIEPIQSRCAFFRFSQLNSKDIFGKLSQIASLEKVDIIEEAIETIIEISNGDLRKAINILQATAAMGGRVTPKIVYQTAGSVEKKEVSKLVSYSLNQNYKQIKDTLHELLFNRGISPAEILRHLFNELFEIELSNDGKLLLIQNIAEVDYRITEGASADIQLFSLFLSLGTLN